MNGPVTVLDALLVSLRRAADFNRDDTVPPAAVLWPDEKREWERLVPRLQVALPHFLVFGPYDKPNRTGPAIWLRCVLAGRILDVTLPADVVPIIYLPGVSRATLHATEDCPQELKPLAELQYRGVFWSQANGKDWTLAAFLQTENGGLGLKIAKDAATASSIRRVIDKLVDVQVADLAAKSASGQLDSEDFDKLISDDPVDDLLTWLSDPTGTKNRWEPARWEALCSRSVAEYDFDPVRDGELVGAEKLGLHSKATWKTAWKRFAAAPLRYPGLTELLRKAKPQRKNDLFASLRTESWPQDNEAEEADLRTALQELSAMPAASARKQLQQLESKHKPRRDWVWAKLARSPLACAIQHLSVVAEATETPLTAASTDEMIQAYTTEGWRADAAMLDSLAAVTAHEDHAAVCTAIQQVYTPWLRDAAELFQQRVKEKPLAGREVERLAAVPNGTCVLFADGLRFDVARKLRAALEGRVGGIEFKHHTVALPSVTPTAKPAISPVARLITGITAGEEFRPSVTHDGKELTIERFRKLLDDDGFQVLANTELGDPEGRAWTEYGNLDQTGHNEGCGLAKRIPELLAGLVARIEALLAAGWQEVRVVTDHGWLVLPGGLPKADLPKYLTATRWGRCAVVKPSATVELTCFGWFWSDDVRIACPRGIDCFVAGKEYSHGGLSLQECVVPQISIRRGTGSEVSARIESVKWSRLRCRIKITGDATGCLVDLRDRPADPSTSLTDAKPVAKDGTASLVVENDTREGSGTILVLLDANGAVVEKLPVMVGG